MRSLAVLVPLISLTAPLVGLAAGSSPPPASPAAAFESTVRPFLTRHCARCHDPKTRSGELDLSPLGAESVAGHRETWAQIVRKLRTGEMPPPGNPRPPAAEVQAVVTWAEAETARAEHALEPDPGRVTARRLNRAEYNNTVRDLLGVELRPADDFPQDDSGYGFDNIGDVLSVSPVLTERYLDAAEKVARTAIFGPAKSKPTLVQLRVPPRPIEVSPRVAPEYDETGLTLPNSLHVRYRFPVTGEYVFRAHLNGVRPLGSAPMTFAVWIDGQQVSTKTFDPGERAAFDLDRQVLSANVLDFRAPVTAGDHLVSTTILHLYEGLPLSYGGPKPSTRAVEPPKIDFEKFIASQKPPDNATPQELEEFRQRIERLRERIKERQRQREMEVLPANDARVSSLEIGGPYEQATGPSAESKKKLYVCGHTDGRHKPGCGRMIVEALARRAFRRPVTAPEVDRYLRLYTMARKQGGSFEDGICLAAQGILVSPHFLFRVEQEGPDAGSSARETGSVKLASAARKPEPEPARMQPISQYELASRLSYFLWSSMPDEELLRCADRGALRKPEVLGEQVLRMLRDPRSRALVENFAGQWLELRKLEASKPDPERFPQFDEYLRYSMQRETELFLEDVIRRNRSLLELIDSDHTFLNERLARFYGISGIEGTAFREVPLTGTRRGGILTQASVLTVSSYSTRTSPVIRGRWILENILNAAPPPPPPDVPNLDEAKIGRSATLRQQLEAHRVNPTCAACHARMDPLGFALENFDAIGAWRTQDGQLPVDASARLPDGRAFSGPDELKKILETDRDAFTRCVAEKLLTYALGRGLEAYDKPTVKRIADRTGMRGYRFSALVQEIVNSLPFQMRRGGAQ